MAAVSPSLPKASSLCRGYWMGMAGSLSCQTLSLVASNCLWGAMMWKPGTWSHGNGPLWAGAGAGHVWGHPWSVFDAVGVWLELLEQVPVWAAHAGGQGQGWEALWLLPLVAEDALLW